MRLLSPGGKRGLSIFIYHRVLPAHDELFPDELDSACFDRQLTIIKSLFNVIPLIDAVRHLRDGTLPPRTACITFDDGYADNAEVALPILLRHGVPATFFVASGFLNGGRMWNDSVIEMVRRSPAGTLDASALGLGVHSVSTVGQRRAAIGDLIRQLKYLDMDVRLARVNQLAALLRLPLRDDLMMTSEQVRTLHRAGMDIGGHTVNHPILAAAPAPLARYEIAEGKRMLEELIGSPVRLFAYPNGKPGADYRAEHTAFVRELGFEGAVSTAWGASRDDSDLFQLPRFSPWDRTHARFALRMARNMMLRSSFAPV